MRGLLFLLIFTLLTTVLIEKPTIARPYVAYNDNDSDEEDTNQAPIETPRKKKGNQRARWEEPSEPMPIGLSGGLSVGAGYLGLRLALTFHFSRWIAVETSGFYTNQEQDKYKSISYGPEADLLLSLPNPTIVTPFVGAGPGYDYWKRSHDSKVFDESGSMTANMLVGIRLAFTANFGLQAQKKWVTYVNTPPLKEYDNSEHEPRSYSQISGGFYVSVDI